ncbi:glycosyltransferase family 4 protein [Crenothrix sp.]|uniref:glycosyltransferase family 4 protein n=1 Tax=Crenothrix sp. TaxID=3100433 RepID=UPI00374D20AE
MKIITLTTLYPNNVKNGHGIFVEQRLRHLLEHHQDIVAEVIAPVPWFPFVSDKFGHYSDFAQVAKVEQRFGIRVSHPRYCLLPKIGMTLAPFMLVLAVYPLLKNKLKNGDNFDLIDAHYFYPDGVAAVILGKLLKKPVVVTARGSDITLIPSFYWPRKMIVWAAQQATAIITVCQDLKDKIVEFGISPAKIHALRNGVDLQFFMPEDRQQARAQLKLDRPTLLSVGHLVELKGHHLIIEAMQSLPDYQLLIAGDGEEMLNLKKLANSFGVGGRVTFLGAISHKQLVTVYSAADILVLASSREGWANVLLEAMACGTPVIATKVSGTPEVVASPKAGILVERSAPAIVTAVRAMQKQMPLRQDTRAYTENYSWDATVHRISELFKNIVCG